MTLTIDPAVRAITVEEFVPHAADVVWKVLTTRELIERWLMKTNFKPGLGQRFTFADHARGDWDGTVQCEITSWNPPRELAYTWAGGSASNQGHGAPLDTLVTWTLTPAPGGTQLRMMQTGFRSPVNDVTYPNMERGWNSILPHIRKIAGEIA